MSTHPAPDHAPQPGPSPQEPARRPGPRTAPIVWGALVLAWCAYVLMQTLMPGAVDTSVFLIAGVLGLGVLLLIVGAVALIRNQRQRTP